MSTISSKIENFNQYVKVNVDGLKARGERTDDLMVNLLMPIRSPLKEFVSNKSIQRDINMTMYTISQKTN